MKGGRERTREAVASLGYYVLIGPVSLVALSQPGWPLPRNISAEAISRGLSEGVAVDAWKAIAFLGWVLWVCLAWSTAAVVVAWARRRQPRGVLVPTALQPLVFRLATGLFVLGSSGATGDLSGPPRLAALVGPTVADSRLALAVSEAAPGVPQPATAEPTKPQSNTFSDAYLLVRRHNTLSGLAASLLRTPDVRGDEVRTAVRELVDANLGAVQADGQQLVDADMIEVGWWLRLPARFGLEPGGYLMVEHGDNAWDLAEECLGGPEDRHELIRLNLGRQQPDGRALQDANYLREFWLLRVPDRFVRPAPDSRSAPAVEEPVTSPPGETPAPAPGGEAGKEPSAPAGADAPRASAPGRSSDSGAPSSSEQHPQPVASVPDSSGGGAVVHLPSGAVVGASFVSGALATVALGRLKRRRRWRPADPAPGLGPSDDAAFTAGLSPAGHDEDGEAVPKQLAPAASVRPGHVEVGYRGGSPVHLNLAGCGGLAIEGPAAEDCVRAIVLAALVQDEEWLLLTDRTSGTSLLGTANAPGGIRLASTPDDALAMAEVELARRARLFERVALDSFEAYGQTDPDEPLASVIVLLHGTFDRHRAGAIARQGSRYGLAVLTVGRWVEASVSVIVDADANVSADGTGKLHDAALFHATSAEASPIVSAVEDATSDADMPVSDRVPQVCPELPPRPSAPWVEIRLFGGYEIHAGGTEIRSGLRGKARELLAFNVLRPSGTTIEAAVDRMWPAADLAQGPDWFKKALANLRKRLRTVAEYDGLDIVESLGGARYRICADEVDADVWRFEAAIAEAQSVRGVVNAEADALARALAEYRGELLDGFLYEWIEPVRADLRNRALDAIARLAELHAEAGRADDALAVLLKGIELDDLAEELYARSIRILCDQQRLDAARRLLARLEDRLQGIGEDPLPTTSAPIARLLATKARQDDVRVRSTGA